MIQISNILIDAYKDQEKILLAEILKTLHIEKTRVTDYKILRRSIDARKKDRGKIYFNYSVQVEVSGDEQFLLKKNRNKNVSLVKPMSEEPLGCGDIPIEHPPIVIGAGPAGLFAAYTLAKAGFAPIILERGKDIDARSQDVQAFWHGGALDPNSNVQFGEGGAGTFSDGKLTSGTKSPYVRQVLEVFVQEGAPAEILYNHKPHIGTDLLRGVIKNLRQTIIHLGGRFYFSHHVTDLVVEEGQVVGVVVNGTKKLSASCVLLAIGHSARDTFRMLATKKVDLQAKSFAIGLRIEHPQALINKAQYGDYINMAVLGAADYKLTYQTTKGRGVYSFCMCPGGYVVASASEPEKLVVNGMSFHRRSADNANSALIVSVHPADFADTDPLAGVAFQEYWEQQAFIQGGRNYFAPVQLLGDFLQGVPSKQCGTIIPSYQPGVRYADVALCLPDFVSEALHEAVPKFAQLIEGFDHPDAILTGIETRTSSPVRILRNASYVSPSHAGLYPLGEGAGYAGGIVSAAIDGIKGAESLIKTYRPAKQEA